MVSQPSIEESGSQGLQREEVKEMLCFLSYFLSLPVVSQLDSIM